MEFTRREQIIILVIVLIAVGGTGVIFWSKQKPSEARAVPTVVEQKKEPALPKNIMVYMSGAVSQPGVVTLPAGARVMDALRLAGGPCSGADLDAVNLAALLVDGQQIRIPNLEEPGSVSQTAQRNTRTGVAKISINMADAASLDALPGIGPSMAQKIIDYRTTNGPFSSLEDLKKVSGIGESKYQNLKDKITL